MRIEESGGVRTRESVGGWLAPSRPARAARRQGSRFSPERCFLSCREKRDTPKRLFNRWAKWRVRSSGVHTSTCTHTCRAYTTKRARATKRLCHDGSARQPLRAPTGINRPPVRDAASREATQFICPRISPGGSCVVCTFTYALPARIAARRTARVIRMATPPRVSVTG